MHKSNRLVLIVCVGILAIIACLAVRDAHDPVMKARFAAQAQAASLGIGSWHFVRIGKCEYIATCASRSTSGTEGWVLTHRGDCDNPEHKRGK